jgi:VWFA-related protein
LGLKVAAVGLILNIPGGPCGFAAGQETSPEQPVLITATVNLVPITATVVDSQGRNVAGLRKEDFRVYEDDVPQTIAVFAVEEKPLSLGIVFDTSGSMVDKIDDVQDSVKHFVNLINPEDDIFLLRFSSDVKLVVDSTADRKKIARAVDRLEPRGATRLYDAIAEALEKLSQGRQAKKALLLLTDGNDTASDLRLNDLLTLVRKSEVLIYALGIGHGNRGSFGHRGLQSSDEVDLSVLNALADASGGRSFYLDTPHRGKVDMVDQSLQQVSAELRQQYTIGYYPPTSMERGAYHRLRVEPINTEFSVRSRHGYYASPNAGSR